MIKKPFLLMIVLFVSFHFVYSTQYPLLVNIYGRQDVSSLDGNWQFIIDPYEKGSYDYHRIPLKGGYKTGSSNFSDLNLLTVPGDWNTQKEELLYYEGA